MSIAGLIAWIIVGIIGIINAFRGSGIWSLVLGGLNLIFGLILLFNPVLGAAALPFVLGILGIIGGIMLLVLAFQARSAARGAAAAA